MKELKEQYLKNNEDLNSFNFEMQTERESVIKKNRLMLEKTIVTSINFNS